MIAILVGLALAAPRGDLWVQYPAIDTGGGTFYAVDPTGAFTVEEPGFAFQLGLGGGLELGRDPTGGPLVSAGVDLCSRTWEHTPEAFGVSTWDGWVGLGWRGRGPPTGKAGVSAWADASMTVHTQVFLPTWYDGLVTTTPGAQVGMGMAAGRGAVRPFLGGQVGFVVGNAQTGGQTSNTPDDFAWQWHAGRAWLRMMAGVSLGRKAEPAPDPQNST